MQRLGELSGRAAVAVAIVVTLGTGGVVALAFDSSRAGTPSLLLIWGAAYLGLAVVTAAWLHRTGKLRERLRPAYGDVSKGFAIALVLYAVALAAHQLLTGFGSPRAPWIIRAYQHLGSPEHTHVWYIGLGVLVIAAAEELVWRGGVMELLAGPLGNRRALWLSTLLYGLSYAPTVVLLADPFSGLNPLLPVAALVGGAVWGLAAQLFRRTLPVMVAHGLTAWGLVAFPLWAPGGP